MVFTGIVEEMGVVQSIENLQSEEGHVTLTVKSDVTHQGVRIGDSISVNGTCLTVTHLGDHTYAFGLAPETLRRTNLGRLREGAPVNLERSMAADGRFGGHVVQAHVDCTGRITAKRVEKEAMWFTICISKEMMTLVVQKGYVTVDGASFTVCDVIDDTNEFTFMMIAHTQAHVVTALCDVGDLVNIETDITGKYIARMLKARS